MAGQAKPSLAGYCIDCRFLSYEPRKCIVEDKEEMYTCAVCYLYRRDLRKEATGSYCSEFASKETIGND